MGVFQPTAIRIGDKITANYGFQNPRDMDVFEVKERFTDFIKDGKRLGVLFVTQNGKGG